MLAAIIILMGAVGAYSLKGSYYDIVWMFIFGMVGYLFNKFDFSIPSFVLAFILGGMAENSFRQQLIINHGSLAGFFQRPISCVVLIISIIIFFSPFLSNLLKMGSAKKEAPVG